MSRRKHRRVAVVGSRSFPLTPEVGAEIVDVLRAYPAGTVFLTRGSEGFDTFVMAVIPILGYSVLAYPSPGGAGNFLRDVQLVKDADEVFCFVSLHDLESGKESGTLHVAEKSLDQRKPTRLLTVANRHLLSVADTDLGVADGT